MKFVALNGRTLSVKNPRKYLIDWNGKSLSKFQKSVKDFLHPYWEQDIVFEEFPVVGSRMHFDFFNSNKRVVVEVNGAQHLKYNKFMHGGKKINFLNQLKRDVDKQKFCKENNITFVEIFPDDEVNKALFEKYDIYL